MSFHYEGGYVDNPIYFLHCPNLESADSQHVILEGDVQKMWTDAIHRRRQQPP